MSNFTCAKFLRTKILVNIYEFTASKVSFPIIWFIFHAYIACSISSESEEEQEPTRSVLTWSPVDSGAKQGSYSMQSSVLGDLYLIQLSLFEIRFSDFFCS